MPKTQDKPAPQHTAVGPLRVTATAVGAGLAWAAFHVPPNVSSSDTATQVQVGVETITAILIALSVIKVGVAAIACALRIAGPLLTRVRRL